MFIELRQKTLEAFLMKDKIVGNLTSISFIIANSNTFCAQWKNFTDLEIKTIFLIF